MKLRPLIENQSVFIDAHGHEREDITFSDERFDIHLHKKTKYRVEGSIQEVNIRIPLNSTRPVKITNARNREMEVPRKLVKEIQDAFENIVLRERFVEEVKKILEDYFHVFWDKELAKTVMSRIGNFFGLEWANDAVIFTATRGQNATYSLYQADFLYGYTIYRMKMNWEGIFIESVHNNKQISFFQHGYEL